jgi:hypothetical protein
MSLPILLAYFDYCKENKLTPNPKELRLWKLNYNNR